MRTNTKATIILIILIIAILIVALDVVRFLGVADKDFTAYDSLKFSTCDSSETVDWSDNFDVASCSTCELQRKQFGFVESYLRAVEATASTCTVEVTAVGEGAIKIGQCQLDRARGIVPVSEFTVQNFTLEPSEEKCTIVRDYAGFNAFRAKEMLDQRPYLWLVHPFANFSR